MNLEQMQFTMSIANAHSAILVMLQDRVLSAQDADQVVDTFSSIYAAIATTIDLHFDIVEAFKKQYANAPTVDAAVADMVEICQTNLDSIVQHVNENRSKLYALKEGV